MMGFLAQPWLGAGMNATTLVVITIALAVLIAVLLSHSFRKSATATRAATMSAEDSRRR